VLLVKQIADRCQSGCYLLRNFHKRMYLLGTATSYIILPPPRKYQLVAALRTAIHNWTETCFLSPQICWLRNFRSVEKSWFGCQWKECPARFCCLLYLSSDVMSRASFSTFFTAFEICRIYEVRCFKLVAGILYCNFFLFYTQLWSSRPIATSLNPDLRQNRIK